jgi:hypothetical protein
MSIVVTYLAYLLFSAALTLVVGQVLARSGRLFLLDAVGGSDSAAKGISSLIVVTFYLISMGFVALTLRASGDSLTARQAIQLLATKIGEVLLVLGALYLAGIVTLTRLRRRLRLQAEPGAPGLAAEPGASPAGTSARPEAIPGPRGIWRPAPQELWRPSPRRTAGRPADRQAAP